MGLGSNIEPSKNIKIAINQLIKHFRVLKVSSIWESESSGSIGPEFLNSVVAIETEMTIKNLKSRLLEIEAEMGRKRGKNKNAPRTIDMDILLYDKEVIDPDIWTQPYLAIPLAEIYPSLVNPENGENILNISKKLYQQYDINPKKDIMD